jgi:hypothetical protein
MHILNGAGVAALSTEAAAPVVIYIYQLYIYAMYIIYTYVE